MIYMLKMKRKSVLTNVQGEILSKFASKNISIIFFSFSSHGICRSLNSDRTICKAFYFESQVCVEETKRNWTYSMEKLSTYLVIL